MSLESFGDLLGLRNKLRNENAGQVYRFTNNQAYLIAAIVVILVVILYVFLVGRKEVRLSTALVVAVIAFLVVVDTLDFPDRRWFRVLTTVIIAFAIIEIIIYEIYRVLNNENKIIDTRNQALNIK